MARRLSLFLLVLSLSVNWQESRAEPTDTLTKANPWTQRNRFPVRARSFLMATDNQPGLTDAYALAIGVGVGYQTPRLFGHLQLGGSAFFSANVLSSDLAARDPQAGQPNRYEVGLADVQSPGSHALISRVEELYARYQVGKKSSLILGRQLLSSPFINPQDGRLSPTFVEGLTAEWLELANTKVQLTYLTRIAPRSTVGWHSVGESIGLYPVGLDPTGKPSQYAGNTQSASIIQLGITRKTGNVVVQLWHTRVQNVFNLTYARADLVTPSPTKRQWVAGFQLARQWAIGNGGNAEPTKAYMLPGNRALVFSGRVGYQTPNWATYLNATRITSEGRFLMPREWGRDPFYTFLARERNEGFGNLTAISANLFVTPTPRLKAEISMGYYHLPDVKNTALNKYGMPTYTQTNIGATYRFSGMLNGFDLQALWITKTAIGDTYNNARYVFNKVGMSQLDLIINYHL